jgi:hypothetical protein
MEHRQVVADDRVFGQAVISGAIDVDVFDREGRWRRDRCSAEDGGAVRACPGDPRGDSVVSARVSKTVDCESGTAVMTPAIAATNWSRPRSGGASG